VAGKWPSALSLHANIAQPAIFVRFIPTQCPPGSAYLQLACAPTPEKWRRSGGRLAYRCRTKPPTIDPSNAPPIRLNHPHPESR
jgi:hypothetical protein